jgi:hypothetical protein
MVAFGLCELGFVCGGVATIVVVGMAGLMASEGGGFFCEDGLRIKELKEEEQRGFKRFSSVFGHASQTGVSQGYARRQGTVV